MLARGGRLRQPASGLHILSSRLRSSHNQPTDSNDPPTLNLKLIVPPSAEPQEFSFDDSSALDNFVKSIPGSLRATGPNGKHRIISPTRYKQLLPTEIYHVHSPFFDALRDEPPHSQIVDPAFGDKARLAMMKYLSSAGIGYSQLSRTIKAGDRQVAEWEGAFELEGHAVYFLECKHTVTNVQNPHTACVNITLGYFGRAEGKDKKKYGGFGESAWCWEMFSRREILEWWTRYETDCPPIGMRDSL